MALLKVTEMVRLIAESRRLAPFRSFNHFSMVEWGSWCTRTDPPMSRPVVLKTRAKICLAMNMFMASQIFCLVLCTTGLDMWGTVLVLQLHRGLPEHAVQSWWRCNPEPLFPMASRGQLHCGPMKHRPRAPAPPPAEWYMCALGR